MTPIDVDLSARGIQIPHHGAGMVLVQPHLKLTSQEPYRCTDQSRARHLDALAAGLSVARDAPHGADKTHFTVFPEYSIPSPQGIELVQKTLCQEDWPNQTIIIGGADGLSAAEYTSLAGAPNTHVEDDPASVPADHWLNCGIIWTKAKDGTVERWLQPKLHPSWLEQNVANSSMYTGNTVFVFTGDHDSETHYRFGVLLCFDWIAEVCGTKPWRAVVEALSRRAAVLKADLSLSWLFVIQHNRRPSDESFMREVDDFFDPNIARNVRREGTCIVFANSAGRAEPGKAEYYGHSSLIFAQHTPFKMPTCYGTFCTGGPRFRRHGVIRHHKDFLFRERGACIHSFEQVNPGSIGPGAPGYTIALKRPFVHPLGPTADPRVPRAVVPASVKWLNDELDTFENLADRYPHAPLAPAAEATHQEVKNGLRSFPGSSVDRAVALACPACACPDGDPAGPATRSADEWGDVQRDAVMHIVDTVTILAIFADVYALSHAAPNATLSVRELNFDVVAIRAETHKRCCEHYAKAPPLGRRPVLLVTRDTDNNEWSPRLGSYLEVPRRGDPSGGDFTRPHLVSWHLGYKNLLDIFRDSATVEQAKESFDGNLRS